jgi:hypothetical protein
LLQLAKQAEEVFTEVLKKLQELGQKIESSRALFGNGATLDAQRRIVALETLLQNEKAVLEVSKRYALANSMNFTVIGI